MSRVKTIDVDSMTKEQLLADQTRWLDEANEAALMETEDLLRKWGATPEELAAELNYQRAQCARTKEKELAEFRAWLARDFETLQ